MKITTVGLTARIKSEMEVDRQSLFCVIYLTWYLLVFAQPVPALGLASPFVFDLRLPRRYSSTVEITARYAVDGLSFP
jgi:hypothetical protein